MRGLWGGYLASSSGKLLVAGTAYSNEISPYHSQDYSVGAYVMELDSNLSEVFIWNNIGYANIYNHLNVGDMIELESGNFAISGQMKTQSGPVLSLLNTEGVHLSTYTKTGTNFHYPLSEITESDNGIVNILFSDSTSKGRLWMVNTNDHSEDTSDIRYNSHYTSEFLITNGEYYFGGHTFVSGNWGVIFSKY